MKLINKEFLFAFFLLSGTLKGILGFVPVDITIISLGGSILTVFLPILIKKEIPKHVLKPTVLYLLLAVFIVFSILYSQSNAVAIEKAFRFLTVTGWSFIGLLFIIKDKKSLERFFSSFLVLSFIMGIASLSQYISNKSSTAFVGALGANYIALGRMAGFGVLILICLFLYNKKNGFLKTLLVYLSILFLSISLFLSGGRMPVIALGISILVILFYSARIMQNGIIFDKGIRKLLTLILIVFLGLIPLYVRGFFNTFIMRMEILFTGNGGVSVTNRFDRMETAIKMFVDDPIFGKGIGSFSLNYNFIDINDYPHNIFVEFLSETGVIGFFLFCVLLIFSLMRYFKARKVNKQSNRYHLLIFSFFVYMFVTVNVAGDINDNRLFFSALGLLCVSPLINLNEYKNSAMAT